MSYTKTNWKNGQAPALNETNLNKIEQGIADAHEIAAGRQEMLVSGQNIKTINGENVLGAGDISIAGGAIKVITYAESTSSTIKAHEYQSAKSVNLSIPSGYKPIGVVGFSSSNYRIRPSTNFIEDTNKLRFGLANASAESVSSGVNVTFYILCVPAE